VTRIHLIHWQKQESETYASILRNFGYEVDCTLPENAQFFKSLRASLPDLMVVDLSRLPSQGRDIVINMRSQKSSQLIPVVFVEGDPQKTGRIQQLIPDATYTSWDKIEDAINQALKNPPATQKQSSVFAAYRFTPLLKKLTIQPDMQICLIHAPEEFLPLLGPLPENVHFNDEMEKTCRLIIWFVFTESELVKLLPEISKKCMQNDARVWICWQKMGSTSRIGITQNQVREKGLASGLVDYKICSIDSTWSGLLFRWRGFGK
jgi:DNA-binding NarL/FixJ family response regulator